MKLASSTILALLLTCAPALASAQETDEPAPPAPAPAPAPATAPPPPRADLGGRAAPLTLGPEPDSAAEPDARRASALPRYDYLRFGAGFRLGNIGSSGLDTFADDDVLAQGSLDATYAFFTRGKLAIAAGLAWDVGSRASGARGLDTRLTVHRLTIPIEARWYFAPWLDVFAKIAPGAGAYAIRIEDPSSPTTLEHAPWVFAADLSAGASVRLAGGNDHQKRRARLWLTSELGYGLTSSASLRPKPDRDEEDILGSDQRTRLGSLAVNGVFWRTGLGLSF